jgi:hypothetical protein
MSVRDPAEYKETAAQESRKLRTALIAKVLTEKCMRHFPRTATFLIF